MIGQKKEMAKDILVVGLGNVLMADEGIGCVLVNKFIEQQEKYPDIEFIEVGTKGMTLFHSLADRKKAILIDCALMGTEPGTIRRFTPEDVRSVKHLVHQSLHEGDVMRIIEMAGQLGARPDKVIIFGIEPESVEPERSLTETLLSRVEEYVAQISKELSQ